MEKQETEKEDEDLDYHITFPRPGQGATWVERETEGTQLEPVVFLLGWTSCKESHLAKYTQIYEERCITIRYRTSMNMLFMQPNGLESTSEKLWELLFELGLEGNPVFIHAFSTGGGMLCRQMVKATHGIPCYAAVKVEGCILDSLPSPCRPYIAAKLANLAHAYNAIIRFMLAVGVFIFFYLVSAVQHMLGRFGVTVNFTSLDYWKALHGMCNCPQLYIYSKADKLVPHFYIEQHIQDGHNHRLDIWSKCWPDTGHVQHFRLHEEEYTTLCHKFVQHCLVSTQLE